MCLGMLCAVLGGVRHVCHGLRVIDPVVHVCVCARARAWLCVAIALRQGPLLQCSPHRQKNLLGS